MVARIINSYMTLDENVLEPENCKKLYLKRTKNLKNATYSGQNLERWDLKNVRPPIPSLRGDPCLYSTLSK